MNSLDLPGNEHQRGILVLPKFTGGAEISGRTPKDGRHVLVAHQ
ncbi:Uncharacterised protein [Mycobacteroides abscessus subsp. abscessus]|nr:Uncharacterised protein [Mycobacteroides abscessus subsp. abscessus]